MGKSEYSFDGFDGLDKALLEMVNVKFPYAIRQEVNKLAGELHAAVKEKTPSLDPAKPSTGHLRRHWEIGSVKRVGDEYVVEVYNNIHYAGHVEYGHRTKNGKFVEGAHMMQISLSELEQRLPDELKQWLDDFVANNPL